MNKVNIFLTVALIITVLGCNGSGGANQMTLTTTEQNSVSIYLAGSGEVTIDWGDQTVETHELTPFDDNEYFGENAEYRFRHEYADRAVRIITVTGDVTAFRANYMVTELDVSRNAALRTLDCWNNRLTTLDVSRNAALIQLNCGENQLTALDVSGATALKMLYCSENTLTALKVGDNAALEILRCVDNQLTAIDVSRNAALVELSCGRNQLTALDVSRNTALTELDVSENQFTAAALNTLFATLHDKDLAAEKNIYIYRTTGSADCDPTIARTKGWKVSGFEGGHQHRTDDITDKMKQEAIFLGMIGAENRKMGIAFLNIVRLDDKRYEVTGKSKVRDNICDFRGVVNVEDATYDGTDYFEGAITGKYLFEEDRNQSGTGVFEGTFKIVWNNENLNTYFASIAHDEVEFNVGATFSGTWKSYRTGSISKACWGNLWECKPCCINDGTELWVSEEYRSSGWALEIDRVYYWDDSAIHPEYLEWFEWWK